MTLHEQLLKKAARPAKNGAQALEIDDKGVEKLAAFLEKLAKSNEDLDPEVEQILSKVVAECERAK